MTRRLSTGRLLTAPAGTVIRDEFAHDLTLARSACGDFPPASGAAGAAARRVVRVVDDAIDYGRDMLTQPPGG